MQISKKLRIELAKPFGPVMEAEEALPEIKKHMKSGKLLIAVGDRSILNLLGFGIRPNIGIYDGLTKRQPIPDEFMRMLNKAAGDRLAYAKNPAGGISEEMKEAVLGALGAGDLWVRIEGEDDLCSLIVMAHAPIGSLLIYGQPDKGAVLVKIGRENSAKAKKMLNDAAG